MFTHLFKLIWNKKKQNFLLITEMFVSFIVMFAVFTLVVRAYQNYRQPMGMNDEGVWVVNYTPPENLNNNDSVMLLAENIRRTLKSLPQIKEVSFTGNNIPFSMNTNTTEINSRNGQGMRTNNFTADGTYKDVLGLEMTEGQWFGKENQASRLIPVVINQKLKEELFGSGPALGQILGEKVYETGAFDERFKVIGVVANLKEKGDYQPVEAGMYRDMDTGAYRWNSTLLLKVQPGADAAFESRLFKTLAGIIGTSIEIEHLSEKRSDKNKMSLVPMLLMLIVGGFLIVNVALGLFGVLWYNINKRRGEIGLRRAVGASGASVSQQLVGEALVLSTLALLVGFFFAVQFPLLNVFDLPASVYLVAIALAVGFIYVLVFVCALYPGRQAAAIYPAVALHEE